MSSIEISNPGILLSKRVLYVVIALAAAGAGMVSIVLPETVIVTLFSPISVLLVVVVPGLFVYLSLSKSEVINVRTLIYGMGLSAVLLMALGFTVNLTHQITVSNPLRPLPVWLSFAALLILVSFGIEKRVPGDEIRIALPTSVKPYLFGSIPVAAGVGAIILGKDGPNSFVLLALGVIALVYIVGAYASSHRVALLYCLALGLLLHNTLVSEFLLWGDQGKEARLVYSVLQAGHWDPTALPRPNKSIMLLIVILHPVHSLLTGLNIWSVFKIVHPFLFAIAPVALYRSFAVRDRVQAGYFAAGALMFFFSFFTVLSRNTRTAGAILFIILFSMTLLDTDISPRLRRGLLSVFGASVVVSHYGAGFMFLTIVGGGFLLTVIGLRFFHHPNQTLKHFPGRSVTLVGLFSFAWYTYIPSNAATFNNLMGYVIDFILHLQSGFFQPLHSATANYAVSSYSSISLTGMKILTIVLFAVIGLGWLVAVSRAWRGDNRAETDASYLGLSAIAGALALVTFLPVERFNTARTFAVVLAVVSPLFAIGIEGILDKTTREYSTPNWALPLVCLGILIPFFIFSSGLFAATVNHDYSPNVLVYQNEVIEKGSPASKSYLYKQHLSDRGAQGGRWLNDHGTGTIFGSQWPGNPRSGIIGEDPPDYEYQSNISAATPAGCIYLSPLSVNAGVISLPSPHLENKFMATSELHTTSRSRVYASGGVEYYC